MHCCRLFLWSILFFVLFCFRLPLGSGGENFVQLEHILVPAETAVGFDGFSGFHQFVHVLFVQRHQCILILVSAAGALVSGFKFIEHGVFNPGEDHADDFIPAYTVGNQFGYGAHHIDVGFQFINNGLFRTGHQLQQLSAGS